MCERYAASLGHAPPSRPRAPAPHRARPRRVAAVGVDTVDESAAVTPPGLPARAGMVGVWVALGLALLAAGASLPFVWGQTHNVDKADFRAATRYVSEGAASDDLLVFLMPYVQRGFAYYHPQPVRSGEPPYTPGMTAAQGGREDARLDGGEWDGVVVSVGAGFLGTRTV